MLVLRQLHDYLYDKIYPYQKWHNTKSSSYIHLFILIFTLSFLIDYTAQQINIYRYVKAETNTVTVNSQPNYVYPITNELLAIDYSRSSFTDGYLQLAWTSTPEVKYISINLINDHNQVSSIADHIKNRSFYSAYLPNNNYQIIQIIGYDQAGQPITNIPLQF